MRQIKFRGKRFTRNEWLRGYFYKQNNGLSIIRDDSRRQEFPVREETIGQFTGLKDKNGVDIYEGDILDFCTFDFNDNDTHHKGVVEFPSDLALFLIRCLNEDCNDFELGWVANQDCELEVIGNIYDNKELLEEKE